VKTLAVAVSLVVGATASATPRLSHVPGAAGCLSAQRIAGCTHLGGVSAVERVWADTRPAGDGRAVYLVANGSLSVLRRDPLSGALRQVRTDPRCIGWDDKRCLRLPDFAPSALTLSPDGRSLYVASAQTDYAYGNNAEWSRFDVLRRDALTGAVSPLDAPGACFANAAQESRPKPAGCTAARGLRLPQAVVVSPDGRFVYVGSSGGISVFRRLASGGLEQLPGSAGCILAAAGTRDCARRPTGVGGTYALALSSDGRNVYALAQTGPARSQSDVILSFARDAETGALTSLAGSSVDGLSGWPWGTAMALSPDGRNLYFANGDTIVTLLRRPDGTLETGADATAMRRLGASWDPAASQALVSPDGRSVYVVSPGGVQSYDRDPATGRLADAQCLTAERQRDCERLRPVVVRRPATVVAAYVGTMALTGDGRDAYIVVTARSGATYISTYARR
jgi:DNA-binding beta-propeller fold protein YncE